MVTSAGDFILLCISNHHYGDIWSYIDNSNNLILLLFSVPEAYENGGSEAFQSVFSEQQHSQGLCQSLPCRKGREREIP